MGYGVTVKMETGLTVESKWLRLPAMADYTILLSTGQGFTASGSWEAKPNGIGQRHRMCPTTEW